MAYFRHSLCCLFIFMLSIPFLDQQRGQAAPDEAINHSQTAATPAASQDVGPESATVLKVTTRLVVVDVVALDHKGAPVTDLRAEDFSLQEEGAEQNIRVFNFQQSAQSTG